MKLAEQLDPEAWHTIVDRFFQILTEGVHRLEGTVQHYTGDGIMALFAIYSRRQPTVTAGDRARPELSAMVAERSDNLKPIRKERSA